MEGNIYFAEMRKIMDKRIVIGSPGAGKSTFARELRDLTGIPLYYLDMLWHIRMGLYPGCRFWCST